MTPEIFARVEELFERTKSMLPAERAALLDHEQIDSDLKAKVLRMLAVHDETADLNLIERTLSPGEFLGVESVGQSIGPYKLVEKIGSGGFGDVYMAQQRTPLSRLVALKILKPGMDSRAVIARFKQEQQALAVMDHPNIAQVFDAGTTHTGRPYFVMELIKGDPITTYCDRNRLTIAERLDLFVQVCQAVQHAHQKAVIHRDIKPSNVLVSTVDGRPQAKVIDFGIAKALGHQLVEMSHPSGFRDAIGTPAYMSPEQAASSLDIDTRTDVYSLGVVLYELLAGSPPFDVQSLQMAARDEMYRIIREDEPVKPSTRINRSTPTLPRLAAERRVEPHRLNKAVRGDLDWIVMMCLEKDRKRRYPTASGLADDLARYLTGDPVKAAPPSTAYRLRKFVVRRKGPVLAGLAIFLTLVAGIAGTRWQANLASEQRDKVAGERDRAQKAESEQRRLAESESVARHQADEKADEADKARAAETKLREDIEYQAYIANVEMAGAAMHFREFNRARDRLAACPERLRGWEWQWLNAAMDNSLAVIHGHSGPINFALFSPNGKLLLTTSDDCTAHVWDAYSGASIAELKGHSAIVTLADFSSDSEHIVTASLDMTAKVWNPTTGTCIATLRGPRGAITSVAFSPDKSKVVTASLDMTAQVWSTATWSEVTTFKEHTGSVHSAAFDPTSKLIVTASLDRTARIWNADTAENIATLVGHTSDVLSAAFSRDGNRLVTASSDMTARVWNCHNGMLLAELKGHSAPLRTAQFSPDDKLIVTASEDKTGVLWDAVTGRRRAELKGHSNELRSASFSPDGLHVLTGSLDTTSRIWDAKSGIAIAELIGHTGGVLSAAFSPDGQRVVTASQDSDARVWSTAYHSNLVAAENKIGSARSAVITTDSKDVLALGDDGVVRRWNIATRSCIAEYSAPSTKCTFCSINADNTRVLTTSEDSIARIWDTLSNKKIADLHQEPYAVTSAAFSPDGTLILTTGKKGPVRVWDSRTGAEVTVLGGQDASFLAAAFDPNGTRIATTPTNGGVISLWDIASGRELAQFSGHKGDVDFIGFSRDGKRVAAASKSFVGVWDIASAAAVMALHGKEREFELVKLSGDGTRLVTVSMKSVVKVWDVDTGTTAAELRGHTGWISSVEFNTEGSRILTASWDNTARLWDALNGSAMAELKGHSGWVYTAAFSPDCSRIVTTSRDKTLRIWDTRPLRERFVEEKSSLGTKPSSGEVVDAALDAAKGNLRTVSDIIEANSALNDKVRDAALAILIVRCATSSNRRDVGAENLTPENGNVSSESALKPKGNGNVSVKVVVKDDLATHLRKTLVICVTNAGAADIDNVVVRLKCPDGLRANEGHEEVAFGAGRISAGFSREAPVVVKADRAGTYEVETTCTYKGGFEYWQRSMLSFKEDRQKRAGKARGVKEAKVHLGRLNTESTECLLSYSVELPPESLENADFLWMDNGEWMGDDSRGTHIIKSAGLHRISVLVITKQNEEYRGTATIEVDDTELRK